MPASGSRPEPIDPILPAKASSQHGRQGLPVLHRQDGLSVVAFSGRKSRRRAGARPPGEDALVLSRSERPLVRSAPGARGCSRSSALRRRLEAEALPRDLGALLDDAAEAVPDWTVLHFIDTGETFTYRDQRAAVNRLANGRMGSSDPHLDAKLPFGPDPNSRSPLRCERSGGSIPAAPELAAMRPEALRALLIQRRLSPHCS
ncbi:MAG: AMP-binding protein [Microvirga sp.]|jgi:hypothetical protein|nr:AMP-binding protein [Rhodospirillales bacterium]MDF2972782.1 AMP-binding protein [Microvirga sp.]